MALTCNIDRRGATVRRIWGTLCLLAAVAAGVLAWHLGLWWLWVVAALAVAAGLFAFYEARKKWCVVRAMGIKTPV